jgi:uncharacterized protein (TIGR02594 family)
MSIVDLVGGSVVRVGSQNKNAVLAIQAAVHIATDDNFGPATKLAVEQFQTAHGLKSDGEVGHMTAMAMDAIAAAPPNAVVQITSAVGVEPVWNRLARTQIGIHEVGDNSGPDVARYIAGAHAGALGDPWCSIFACWALESCGIRGTRSASSQSFRSDPNFVKLDGPAFGAIVVFWRSPRAQGVGHVGFYQKETSTHIFTLGGNEGDMVKEEWLPKAASSFGLEGYYWPKAVDLPKTGPVTVTVATPLVIVKVT